MNLKTIFIFIFVFCIKIDSFGQSILCPDIIQIDDQQYHPFVGTKSFKYQLVLKGNHYQITRLYAKDSKGESVREKRLGKVDKVTVSDFLSLATSDSTFEICYSDFDTLFAKENAIEYISRQDYIRDSARREYFVEKLTDSTEVLKHLKKYFSYYDFSKAIDGGNSKLSLSYSLNGLDYTVSSISEISYALPINFNGVNLYNPRLSVLLSEIVPDAETKRREQLTGAYFYDRIARDIVISTTFGFSQLELKNYSCQIDSLRENFIVKNLRVYKERNKLNWNGEKRVICELKDSNSLYEIEVLFSSRVSDGKMLSGVSDVISKYDSLTSLIISKETFKDYLQKDYMRTISVIYDDSCYLSRNLMPICQDDIDYENSILVLIEDEYNGEVYCVLLPDGRYFVLKNSSVLGFSPINDPQFIECKGSSLD